MTDRPSPVYRLETPTQKVVRVRQLTDPLGAWGMRSPRTRIRKETRVRRVIFALVVAAYFGIVGGLYANQPAPVDSTVSVVSPGQASGAVNSGGANTGSGTGTGTRSVIVTPRSAVKPHVRTHSS